MNDDIRIRPTDIIVREFNTTVRNLITKVEKKSRSHIEMGNLDRLKKRISLLKQTMGETAMIHESSPFFVDYAEKIISRDEEFFMTMDIRAEYIKCKGRVEKHDEFIFSLTDSIRVHYNKSSQKERDEVYSDIKVLFDACLEYNIATN